MFIKVFILYAYLKIAHGRRSARNIYRSFDDGADEAYIHVVFDDDTDGNDDDNDSVDEAYVAFEDDADENDGLNQHTNLFHHLQ